MVCRTVYPRGVLSAEGKDVRRVSNAWSGGRMDIFCGGEGGGIYFDDDINDLNYV